MFGSLRNFKIHQFIREKRREFGLVPSRCDFYGWKHFDSITDEPVEDAPRIIGYLVALWKDARMKSFAESYQNQELLDLVPQVHDMITFQVKLATRDRPDLELRGNGMFVRIRFVKIDFRKFENHKPAPS